MTHTNEYNGRKITLIGTAHVSEMSVKEVTDTINEINPDCVAVELDEKRADSIQNQEKYKNLDIIKVLKNNEGFLLLANLVLSSFQRRMGMNVGMKPGDEMLAAMNTAKDKNIPSVMADRP
ncbi:MAG: TraB family protein, partial [Treponema sp.]|nr:TraB family protein [Treponema sp.]